MKSHALTLAGCTRELANARKFPDHNAYKVNEMIVDLVTNYQTIFSELNANARKRLDSKKRFSHDIALGCLKDTAATAAIMKELIFTHVNLNDDGSYEAADLGSGTGILCLGAAIAGMRAGARSIVVHGVDHNEEHFISAYQTLKRAGNHLEFSMLKENLFHPSAFDLIEGELENIRFWISETINSATPSVTIDDDETVSIASPYVRDVDPYPDVVKLLLQHVPDFVKDVRGGKTAFFPDVINGLYKPAESGGTLQLLTSKSHAQHGPLNRIGRDFLKLCDVGLRWL